MTSLLGLGIVDLERLKESWDATKKTAISQAVGQTAGNFVSEIVRKRMEAWRQGRGLL